MSSRKMGSSSLKDSEAKDHDGRLSIKVAERPTFILKTREGESRAVSPSQRNGVKKETETQANTSAKSLEPRKLISNCIEMTNCIKFMDESMQLCENPLDYLYDQQDFLVVGVLGPQGVGKSTILSLLTSNYASNIFAAQKLSHHESGANCTSGIDFYVTKNRVIYLDTQPILSASVIDHSATYDQKKNSTDFANIESNLELQSLQFVAFLFSVCHVIIFVQDWFVDPNLVRFLQTAEMLKPSSTTNMDQDYVEYYPHILFLQNKAEIHDFLPSTLETMRDFYSRAFATSRLQTRSGLHMNSNSVDLQFNLFLIPNINLDDESTSWANEQLKFDEKARNELIEELRKKIHGVSRNSMTPSALTEKNWYHYVSKVMEAIKKSHLSLEYGRLMP
ncbi:protein SMG9 isoform X1 [Venturia canescens]|uniref:protein SMG9 isoform X1 n=1 Tax=Venturia canescens TaxID=32260 RepID=UPI001C9C8703|nr:protein SMG9 isoform X1 [Venturia canescens]